MRLDQYLYTNGQAPSRERAKALVMAGIVYLNGEKADKPGLAVKEGARVEVRGNPLRYVSRGGLKLEKALRVFGLSPADRVCMDVGASTGGFTDCMLQNGASRVYAVDVGYGQLAWKLREDKRVVVLERCNIRHLQPGEIDDAISFFSVDISFISLRHALPVLAVLTEPAAEGVCLIKPQFEAGRDKVGKKGVVREAAVHVETILQVLGYAAENGFSAKGLDYSPIRGPEGNIEFLLYLRKDNSPTGISQEQAALTVRAAHEALAGESG
ncbi:TlyA family RNA methyltransferase [Ruminococcaceae bacterium OttesenSCG-928-I18]|nr:TlyA family RNA methyltransferase [Ruminococcaceae bacterium OttesenSCG-928-I18]